MSGALSFLQSVSGFVQSERDGSADRPCLLGVIDPAYAGLPNLPKVTFEGESTLSGKTYPHLASYVPVASDRVVLVPVGTTYLIIGPVAATAAAVNVQGGSANVAGTVTAGGLIVNSKQILANEAGVTSQPLAALTTTSSFTMVNLPALASFSFTKQFSSALTKIRFSMSFSAYLASTGGAIRCGVLVNGVDWEVANQFYNVANAHFPMSGWTYITGLAAGTYTFQGRWRSPSGFGASADANDFISMHAQEVAV